MLEIKKIPKDSSEIEITEVSPDPTI
jgi:hypothetical protein